MEGDDNPIYRSPIGMFPRIRDRLDALTCPGRGS
jgi:hypothetical protein